MDIVERNISELIPSEYNPRYITDEALEQLKASIQRFDRLEPIIVNTHKERKNIIISGHQRARAAKELGIETFPCIEVNLTRDEERELNIRMNKNTGSWDWDELANYFDVEELTEWGFSEDELFGESEKELTDLSDSIEEEFRVEVVCVNEREQEKAFNDIQKLGYECRLLTL